MVKKGTTAHLQFIVTGKQKELIDRAAKKSGLSRSEYLRKIATGHVPQEPLPLAFYKCCEHLGKLANFPYSGEVNEKALQVLTQMQAVLNGTYIVPETKEISDPDGESVPAVSSAPADRTVTDKEQKKGEKGKKRFLLWQGR